MSEQDLQSGDKKIVATSDSHHIYNSDSDIVQSSTSHVLSSEISLQSDLSLAASHEPEPVPSYNEENKEESKESATYAFENKALKLEIQYLRNSLSCVINQKNALQTQLKARQQELKVSQREVDQWKRIAIEHYAHAQELKRVLEQGEHEGEVI